MRTSAKIALALACGALVVGGAFLVGRVTAPADHQPASQVGDYFDGLRVGEAQGRQEGRAIQEGAALPATDRQPVTDAFNAGYAAGANDAFAGYDGGWTLHVPWIVTLEGGSGEIAYRIQGRTRVLPGVDYYLCPDGHTICHRKR
jgi:hypothetical protein